MRTSRVAIVGALATAGVVSLTACSQTAELQPVAGDKITSVAIATSDVVQSTVGTEVLTWPTCDADAAGTTYTCQGVMLNGEPITSTATGDPIALTVTVGGREVFQGLVTDVIEKAGRAR
ncbi:MAG: hypothetical protein WA988_03105 [Candidatus Nanopelagicales bacterium]